MNVSLILILSLILFIRLVWYFYIKDTGDIRFFIPFVFELLFIYPYLLVSEIGLYWSYLGLISLYLISLSIQIGFIFSGVIPYKKTDVFIIDSKKFYYFIYALLLLMIVNLILSHNNIISMFTNINNIFLIANENAVARYSGNLNISTLYKITTIFSFLLAFMIGSLCAIKFNRKNKLILILYLSLLFIDSIIMAARAGLLLQSMAVISSFITFKYIKCESEIFRISIKKILLSLFSIFIIFGYFLIVQVFRGGDENFDLMPIISHLLTWFVGYIPAYDYWLNHSSLHLTYGARTFSGIADLLNINQRMGGVYEPVNIGNHRETNIFTAFRGLVEDFSIVGAYLIMMFSSFILSVSLKKARLSGDSFFTIIAICIMYFYSWFFVINPFIYNSIVLSTILFLVILKIFFRIRIYD